MALIQSFIWRERLRNIDRHTERRRERSELYMSLLHYNLPLYHADGDRPQRTVHMIEMDVNDFMIPHMIPHYHISNTQLVSK